MKKRLISMLLTVLMVMSLFSGMTITAHADDATTVVKTADTIQYTMVQGDFVLRICQRLGLNYYTCKQAIMILNNITNDSQWSKLPIGKVLTLPASDADALLVQAGLYGTTGAKVGTTAVTQTIPATTTTTTTPSSVTVNTANYDDVIFYYLIPYTMSAGETVSGVCNNLGVSFALLGDRIKRINEITSWKKVKAGDMLYLPMTSVPSNGTACYAVLQHKVVSGETAYSIASKAGLNYGSMKKFLNAVNDTDDLSKLKAGQWFFYPVYTIINSNNDIGEKVSGGATSKTTTGTDADAKTGASTTTKPDGTVVRSYKLTSNIHDSKGTLDFYVDGKMVTSAPAGVPVSVQVNLKTSDAIESMTIKHADGSADTLLTGDTFIMPACDVRVDVNLKNGHAITVHANYPTLAITTVGGVAVGSAVKGTAVMISSLDPTYSVTEAYVSYKTLMGMKTEAVTNLSQGFVMPDADVTVEVTLKPVATYAFVVADAVNGSFFLSVNNSRVTRAARGAEVTIVAKPAEGYEPKIKTLKRVDTGAAVSYFNNTFTMPASDVEVELEFVSKGNNIIVNPVEGGIFYAAMDPSDAIDKAVDEAPTGETVYILPDSPEAGYTASTNVNDYYVTRNADGLKVKVTLKSGKPSFEMPAGGVTITGKFTSNNVAIMGEIYIDGVSVTKYSDASFFVKGHGKRTEFKASGTTDNFLATYGEYVELDYDCSDAIAFDHYEVSGSATDDELTNQANLNNYFQVDDGAGSITKLTVKAYFVSGKVKLGAATVEGAGTISYELAGKSVSSCAPGETVTIVVSPGEHYFFDDAKFTSKLKVTRNDTGATITPTKVDATHYTVTVPADGISIHAIFDPEPYVLTLKTTNMSGKDLTGKGYWAISVNDSEPIVDNGVTKVDVNFGDRVVVSLTDAGKDNYNIHSFKVDGAEYTAGNYAYNFLMTNERAKDMVIEAVLEEKNPTPTVFALVASYDINRGGAEFVIMESDADPASADKTTYRKTAHVGDLVALVPSAGSGYMTDADHIAIDNGDGAIITPEQITLPSGLIGYQFTMPATNVYASVIFFGTPYAVTLNIVDADGIVTDLVSRGYVQFSTDGTNYKSVDDPASLGNIPYNSVVYIAVTQLAKNENWSITNVTASGTFVAEFWGGYQFTMPNSATTVTITMKKDNVIVPLPLTAATDTTKGSLAFYKDSACTQIITSALPGDTVYVKATEKPGYEISAAGLHVLNALDATMIETAVSPGLWSFEMPAAGVKPVTCTFDALKYTVKLAIDPASTAGLKVMYNNNKTVPVEDGNEILDVIYNTVFTVLPDTGMTITGVKYQIGTDPEVAVSGNTFTIPAAPAGSTITVKISVS